MGLLPDRWRNYCNMSYQIPGTRFVAFKVPLSHSILSRANLNETDEFFDVNCVVEQYPNMGLVIDLTNTDRYYDPIEFKNNNVAHYKLKTAGHIVPANKVVLKFMKLSEDFCYKNYNNDKLIGVHCTHGVNRTGYFIIRYMIQKLSIFPEEAIASFNYARGHSVERENYLADLRRSSWASHKAFLVKDESRQRLSGRVLWNDHHKTKRDTCFSNKEHIEKEQSNEELKKVKDRITNGIEKSDEIKLRCAEVKINLATANKFIHLNPYDILCEETNSTDIQLPKKKIKKKRNLLISEVSEPCNDITGSKIESCSEIKSLVDKKVGIDEPNIKKRIKKNKTNKLMKLKISEPCNKVSLESGFT